MQVVKALDLEDILRIDVAEKLPKSVKCYATPAPDDLSANSVLFFELGGGAQTEVSHVYDISVDVWGNTPGKAKALALEVQAVIASLPMQAFTSGREYKTAEANTPYNNPDPKRPLIPRFTFTATVGMRGEELFRD